MSLSVKQPPSINRSECFDRQRFKGKPPRNRQQASPRKVQERVDLESRKVIISQSRWPLGLLVHIVPVLAAITIITINFRGYFIGTQFAGVTNSASQSIVLSSLQVTAKLFEIIVIASLGYLILDIIHYFLFFDEAGIPLALTGIRLSFNNVFFIVSPTFWSGIRAFPSRRARILVAFLLLSCTLIATFIGPAAALLLIPAIRTDWLAGSLLYQTPPGQRLTWESKLNLSTHSRVNSSIPGVKIIDDCFDPPEDAVDYPSGQFDGCTWSATNSLGSIITPFTILLTGNFTVKDADYGRDISWSTYNVNQTRPTIWTWSSMSITNTVASGLFKSWSWALNGTTSLWGQYSRYAYRDQFGTRSKLQGMLAPSARAACLWSMRDFQDPNPYAFPAVPLNGITPQDTNTTYVLPAALVHNTSGIRTFWVPKPKSAPEIQGADPDMEYATHLPSAFLIAQFPRSLWTLDPEDVTYGPVVTCSIDARWINANQSTVLFNEQELDGIGVPGTYSEIDEATFDTEGRPSPRKLSQRIDLDKSWLDQLTPTFNQTIPGTNLTQASPGYTSLSRIFNSLKLGLDQGTINFDQGVWDMAWRLQLFLSILTVDGIARSDCVKTLESTESAVFDQWIDPWYFRGKDFYPASLLAAGGEPAQLQQQQQEDFSSSLERTEFLWTVAISGYAYAVDSTAYILAVVVLFSYIIFAVCHMCFTIYKRWYSEVWWSIPDIVALAHHSPPSALLGKTSAGTNLSSSNKLLMKLRVLDDLEEGDGTIHLLVDSYRKSSGRDKAKGYHKLEKGKKY